MLRIAFGMQRQRRFIIQGVITLFVFIGIYTLIDHFNLGYREMWETYGGWLLAGNILLNLLMSMIAALMLNLSSALVRLSGKEGKGTFLSALSVLFGMMTYGCTPCVVAFFATIGITFSVAALPLAGLPYKFISLFILLLGGGWLLFEISRAKCIIPLPETKSVSRGEDDRNISD
ncbi:MAG: hypothetical protein PHS68_03265 [Candidatus Izemoplasmatales bacterium]|nr:hypothetical protein [Candidatus Izemoplasmatales bacterium]